MEKLCWKIFRWWWAGVLSLGMAWAAEPFTVNIANLTEGQFFPTGSVPVEVVYHNVDAGVIRVEYYNGLAKVGESLTAPFSFMWTNAPGGTNALRAWAFDDAGANAWSPPVSVVVNHAPQVMFERPRPGELVPLGTNVTLALKVADVDGQIAQVRLYLGANLVEQWAAPPYTATVSNLALGDYTARAVAVDNWGAETATLNVPFSVIIPDTGFFDDFEPDLETNAWRVFSGVVGVEIAVTNTAGAVSGTNSLWFGGDEERYVITRPIALRPGSAVDFYLHYAGDGRASWSEIMLPEEAVQLEYTTNGTDWAVLQVFDGDTFATWRPVTVIVPPEAISAATQFRFHQPAHGGLGLAQWALDDVSITTGSSPPVIAVQPQDQVVAAGAPAQFTVAVRGTPPFIYQWQLNGIDLEDANSNVLQVSQTSTNQTGSQYSVRISNGSGSVTSAVARLTVVVPDSDNFRILSFGTNNAVTIDHNTLTGDDRGGIGASSTQVFITGDSSTARYDAGTLANGLRVGNSQVLDGLVANLRTETLYSLAYGTNYLRQYYYYTVDSLLELDPTTGLWNGKRILLSSPIDVDSYACGVFSGSDRAVIYNSYSQRLYNIALPSGKVTDLGYFYIPQFVYASGWAFYGVAECFNNSLHLVYARDSRNIVRTSVATRETSVLQTFYNLGDMANFTLSLSRQRWYFHHETTSQFRSVFGETLGYAPVNVQTMLVAPFFLFGDLDDQYASLGGKAVFTVSDAGALPRSYQWFHNGQPLAVNTNALVISNVQPADLGDYYLVVSNPFGSVTSSVASLITGDVPRITVHPTNQTVMAGSRLEMVANATGSEPLFYQWYYQDYPWISGTNVLAIDNVTLDYATYYRVVVSNYFGAATSKVAVITVLSPPIIVNQPADVSTLPGGQAHFAVDVTGSEPFAYQWYYNSNAIPGAVASQLLVPRVTTENLGGYSVVVTNNYGMVTSRAALLRFAELLPNTFRISGLFTNNSRAIDHDALTSDDRGCIAASRNFVFYSGDNRTARFSLGDLSGGSTALAQTTPYGGLVSNLRTETVYSFGSGTTLINNGSATINTLLELNGTNLAYTGRSIPLSQTITNGYSDLVCSGFNRVGLYNSNQRIYYDIQLPSGKVTMHGPMPSTNDVEITSSETWSAWGVVEFFDNDLYMVYVTGNWSGTPNISRTRIRDWQTSVVSSFSNLGDMSCFTVSIPRNRWYFHHEGGSQFMVNNASEVVGYADAAFIFVDATNGPPEILQPPTSVIATLGSSARFDVFSYGGSPLSYQWQYNGEDLTGATNAVLVITNVQAEHQGAYAVTISNPYGRAVSTAAQLSLDYGSITNYVRVFALTNAWRYEQSGMDQGTLWRATTFTDTAWPQGSGLLAAEDNAAILPQVRTSLRLTNTSGVAINTYYFRTRFTLPAFTGARQVNLISSNLVDDGAVIYLNGVEKARIRMNPTATITYGSLAAASAPEAEYDVVPLDSSNLQLGGVQNTLAVEVHQQSASSSDVVFGMALYAEVVYPNNPPVISSQPEDLEINYLGVASFSATATGLQPMSYQWYRNGLRLANASGASITMMNVLDYQAGNYYVVISNAVGMVTSQVARLTVNRAPEIWTQPLSQEVDLGQPAEFQPYVIGSPLSFQWWRNGVLLPAATNLVLTLNPTLPEHAGGYYLVVSNALGVVTSETAVLTLRGLLWLSAGVSATNGAFNLHFDAPPGQVYDIEVSETLTNWVRLETVTNVSGSVDFVDPNTQQHPRRYYRLKVLP